MYMQNIQKHYAKTYIFSFPSYLVILSHWLLFKIDLVLIFKYFLNKI